MGTYVLHIAHSSGLAEVLEGTIETPLRAQYFLPRGRVSLSAIRPRGPTAGRLGRPGRPGRPGGGSGGGSWGFRAACQSAAVTLGLATLEQLWMWRWYAIGGMGAYILIRCIKRFNRFRRNVNVQSSASSSAVYHVGENADAEAILSAYLIEMLQKEEYSDLDVYTAATSFCSHPNTGPSVAFYCTEHLHLKVVNQVNCRTPFMEPVKVALDRMRHITITSVNDSDAINEVTNGVSFCGLSQAGQGVGLFIEHELGDSDFWDCCSQSIQEPVFVGRVFDGMSYMAARRLSSDGSLLANMPGDPDFIIFACDGICNLLQNMELLQFAYQGVRNGMPLRALCEMLLQLVKSSTIKMAVVLVQFKTHDQEQAIGLGEGPSSPRVNA